MLRLCERSEMEPIRIGKHLVGGDYPCLIIAEISANHNQDFDQAIRLIKLAKESGADAVKFQTYTPDTMTLNCNNDYFHIKDGPWKGQTLYELYKQAYTPWEWFQKLKNYADSIDITFFSTPFDKTAVDLLDSISVPAYKIASFELVDIPLIQYVASKGKPVMLSTGMGTLSEIELAVNTIKAQGNSQIVLLKCTSEYPAEPLNMNLLAIQFLSQKFECLCGLSDHSLYNEISVAAVCLGAHIIEKHFIDDKLRTGPDAAFSVSPKEFRDLVRSIRIVEDARGKALSFNPGDENKNQVFRRSLFIAQDIKKGEFFTEMNVRSIRPSFGLAPKYYTQILSKKALSDIKVGTPLKWTMVEQ
jgi:pseudaminic acid synthase